MSFVLLVGISTFCREKLVLLFVFDLEEVGVVVDFLSVYPVELYLWAGIHTGLKPCQVLHVCPDIYFTMFLVMAVLRSCEWEFKLYALCRQSLKNNPLSSHCRQEFLGWF